MQNELEEYQCRILWYYVFFERCRCSLHHKQHW